MAVGVSFMFKEVPSLSQYGAAIITEALSPALHDLMRIKRYAI
jgi:hypothetical protein